VFPTSTKDSSVIGLAGLAEVCGAVDVPVVSIGGVSAENAGSTIEAGCAGVAVVSALFAAQDVAAATRQLRARVEGACGAAAARQRVAAAAAAPAAAG
jgi:thiamine monophosphate synthase